MAEKRLIIMRHGRAVDPGSTVDHKRPLEDVGVEHCKEMGKVLREKEWIPDLTIASDAMRVQQTVEAVKEGGNFNFQSHLTSNLYNGGYDEAVAEVSTVEKGISTLMLIGHNPGFSDVVGCLTNRYMSLSVSQTVLLTMEEDEWAKAITALHQWQLVKVLSP